MKKYFLLFYMVMAVTIGLSQQSSGSSRQDTVIFICDHGAYKSVVAAAIFNKLTKEQGLSIHAVARGIDPGKDIAVNASSGLRQDTLPNHTPIPQKLSNDELTKATHVVALCKLPDNYTRPIFFEDWNDIPLVNGNYANFRDSVLPQVKLLINKLKARN